MNSLPCCVHPLVSVTPYAVTPSLGIRYDYLLRLPFAQLRHRPLRCYPLRRCVVEPLSGGQYAVAQLRRHSHLFVFPLCSFAVVRYLLHVIPYAVMPLTRYL